MDWQYTLIHLFLHLCEQYQTRLGLVAQRLSNNATPRFSDEEILTVYLFGLIRQQRTVRDIHTYTRDHLAAFFPGLPSYVGFVQRLNRLADAFPLLIEQALQALAPSPEEGNANADAYEDAACIIDSFPIVMAQQARSGQARVAPELADKGRCASKKLFFYGVKAHVVARRRPGRLPVPCYIGLAPGSGNDLTVARLVLPSLSQSVLYGDKIYADAELAERLRREQALEFITPVKRKRGQAELTLCDATYSERVSRRRQPIESLFNWIEQKTGIEVASRVRSTQGLLVHVFGRMAAAMLLLAFYS